MKQSTILIILSVIFSSMGCCYSQKLVERVDDVYKIKLNEERFINRPLKDLLKEIKPKIKKVSATAGINGTKRGGYFVFNFIESAQKDSLVSRKKTPETIVVYVKEYFEWNFQKRPKGSEFTWTKKDEENYGHLTISAFRIYGGSNSK